MAMLGGRVLMPLRLASPAGRVACRRRTSVRAAAAASDDGHDAKAFTKKLIITEVSEAAGISEQVAAKAVNVMLDAIVQAVVEGKKVQIIGFGTFEGRHRKERQARNPKTGEAIHVPESRSPAFSAGKSFKDAVKGVAAHDAPPAAEVVRPPTPRAKPPPAAAHVAEPPAPKKAPPKKAL